MNLRRSVKSMSTQELDLDSGAGIVKHEIEIQPTTFQKVQGLGRIKEIVVCLILPGLILEEKDLSGEVLPKLQGIGFQKEGRLIKPLLREDRGTEWLARFEPTW